MIKNKIGLAYILLFIVGISASSSFIISSEQSSSGASSGSDEQTSKSATVTLVTKLTMVPNEAGLDQLKQAQQEAEQQQQEEGKSDPEKPAKIENK